MAKRVGIIPSAFAQPLFTGLRQHGDSTVFDIVEDVPAQLALKLRQGHLHGAFLSPIDYAKDYSLYDILPSVGVVSKGESRSVLLVFKEQLRHLETIAIDPRSSSEIVLAHVVLAEKYATVPSFVPLAGSLEDAFASADAVLCTGDTARQAETEQHTLDLVDEWNDISDLPFVHGIWAARRNALSRAEAQSIIESRRQRPEFSPEDVEYLKRFQYDIDEEASMGLAEFFRMAYYHGILQDIPDMTFHPLQEKENAPPDESLN
jgi:predicted solute-binding protein